MLTATDERPTGATPATLPGGQNASFQEAPRGAGGNRLLAKALRIEWLGQMVASLCWIVSVFVYGLASPEKGLQLSPGDWLQLAAASAWFVANLAALTGKAD